MPKTNQIPVGYLPTPANKIKKGNIIREAGKVNSIYKTGELDCWVEDGLMIIEEVWEVEIISPFTDNIMYHSFGATEEVEVMQYVNLDNVIAEEINIEKYLKSKPYITFYGTIELT